MASSFLEDEEIEQLVAKAKEESLRFYHEIELPRQQLENEAQNQDETILSSQVGGKTILYDGVEANGFHLSAGSTYIYPTNYPLRHYQASIVQTALFKNTLVSLPTGLGKTFIAAVVMYNFYRWYPHGKVVFMAPTRPLVAQQTKACHHIMNIPQEDTTEMTGAQSAEQRSVLWKEKRVFYLTPQVMVNDLKVRACPASLIKCIVIDEAHRATKDYAYCQVLKLLSETDAVFRVLGLSATPGNDISAVQQVVQNLHISALEMRSEESIDVVPYVHSRAIDTVVVELSDNIQRVKEDLLQVFEKYATKLKEFKALSSNISSISRFQVLKACEKFRANPPRGLPPAMVGSLCSDFSVCMSLAHALELLQTYGLRAFYTYLSDENSEKNKGAGTRLKNDEHLKEMLTRLQGCLDTKLNENVPYTWGHPKLEKLVGALSEHFQKAQQNKEATKAIIFCQYRVVVTEIVELLMKLKPLIKAAEFVGQSGGKEKGMPQAKQLQIMKDFRNGLINCLVATCVAEEGLDIGEVDLIILMEAHKSPVRLVQRIGRTGRKRKGHCIVLLTKGREEKKFRDAMATRKSYVQNIVNAPGVKSSLSRESPRMIPPQCNPVQQLVHIQASNFESPARPGGKRQADIRKCFTPQVPHSSHTSDPHLLKVKEELADVKLTLDCIPKRHELWVRRHDTKIPVEELLSKDVNGLSEWNEWNYEEQPVFYVSHTSESKLLPHLLKVANKQTLLPLYDNITDSSFEANVQEESILPSKEIRKKIPKVVNKNKGMDIRTCLAGPVGKNKTPAMPIIEILSEESTDAFHSSCLPEPKKLKLSQDDKPQITLANNTLISAYEENNNICSFLASYMPKTTFKMQFSHSLPDVEALVNNVSFERMCNLNFGKVDISETVESFVPNQSNDGISSELVDAQSVKNPCAKTFDTSVTKIPEAKDSEVSNASVTSSSIESVLNRQINSGMDLSFADSDEEYFNIDDLNTENVINPQKLLLVEKSDERGAPCGKNKLDEPLLAFSPTDSPTERRNVNKTSNTPMAKGSTVILSDHRGNLTLQKSFPKNSEEYFVNANIGELRFDSKSESRHISGIPSSTPIASVKKFKKNVMTEKSAPIFTVKESDCNKSPSSEDSDMWNLSDLFEDEDIEPARANNSTMLGVTQMVSLIEKEKKLNCDLAQVSHLNKVENVSNTSEKTSNLSAFLDSDVDIFTEVNDIFQSASIVDKSGTKSEVLNQKDDSVEVNDNKVELVQKEDPVSRPIPSKKELTLNHFKPVENNINYFQSNNKISENIISTKSRSLDFPDSQSENSQPAYLSQSVNFKKNIVTNKKILFSQKMEPQCNYNRNEKGAPGESDLNPTSQNFKSKFEEKPCKEARETSTKLDKNTDRDCTNEFIKRISQVISDDSDDDVFVSPPAKRKGRIEEQNIPGKIKPKVTVLPSIKNPTHVKEKKMSQIKKTPKARNDFIEVEAVAIGFESSDESEGPSLDEFDNSFINDDPECMANSTQTIYLKSLKSPIVQGKFKIPKKFNFEGNVFSQQIVPQDSEYINDSFCVGSDEESDRNSDRSLSILEIAERKLEKKKKSKKKRLRIESVSSSSSSPEKRPSRSESFLEAPTNRKKRRIRSDSETEHSSDKDVSFSSKKKEENLGSPSSSTLNVGECSTRKLDRSLQKLTKKFSNNLDKIRQKYFGSDGSTD